MRRRTILMLLAFAALFAGCTAPQAETEGDGRQLSVEDSFLAARTTDGGIAQLDRNIVRPGDRFLVVLRNVTGLQEEEGRYSFDIGVEVVEEPNGRTVYSADDIVEERNETVVKGMLRFTDVGVTTPLTIDYGTYSVFVTVHDEVGNRTVMVEESLIVSSAEGEPS